MNPQEVFEVWKAQKSEGHAGPEFADRVMAAVRRRETTMGSALKIIFSSHGWLSPLLLKRNLRADPRSPLLRAIAARPWARAAALVLGMLLGLARIIATVHLILFV
jgi:hypothetical protein